jgi:hypothetical protein
VFHSAPWLERSWFLIVPLALNALVLCPIVIRRASRARASGKADLYAGMTNASLYVCSALAILTIVYLLAVFVHQF